MVFDHSGLEAANPARDKLIVRLPLLVLDATGMRLGELEAKTYTPTESRRLVDHAHRQE